MLGCVWCTELLTAYPVYVCVCVCCALSADNIEGVKHTLLSHTWIKYLYMTSKMWVATAVRQNRLK